MIDSHPGSRSPFRPPLAAFALLLCVGALMLLGGGLAAQDTGAASDPVPATSPSGEEPPADRADAEAPAPDPTPMPDVSEFIQYHEKEGARGLDVVEPGAGRANPEAGFYERMLMYETALGRKSRMTLIGQLEQLELPTLPERVTDGIDRAIRSPLEYDVGALGNAVAAWNPAIDLLYAAWELEEMRSFQAMVITDPLPDYARLATAARLLLVRGQANATIDATDAALADFGTVWMIGISLERSRPVLPTYFVGLRLRTLALEHIRALIERRGLSQDQRATVLRLLASHPGTTEPVDEIGTRELRVMFRSLKLADPASADLITELQNGLQLTLDRMRTMSADEQWRAGEEWERAAGEAFRRYPLLAEFGLPNVGDAYLRRTVAETYEHLIASWIFAVTANEQQGGKASARQIEAIAGAWSGRLTDPFTGRAFIMRNGGGDDVLIVSPGPDGALESGSERPSFDPADGREGRGDLYIQSPWDVSHPRFPSEPMGETRESMLQRVDLELYYGSGDGE